jgi:cyanophycin synthetase
MLRRQGYPGRVPAEGVTVELRGNANLSTGGTAEDVTDLLPESTRALCVRAAAKIGLDVAGIDIVCRDIACRWTSQGGAVIEVNAAPGIRMHQHPSSGAPRDAGDAIVEGLMGESDGRIPIIAVHRHQRQDHDHAADRAHGAPRGPGHGRDHHRRRLHRRQAALVKGDCTGYWSARTVLSSPDVEFAVLETARGGILKRGLAFDRCDVGMVLNVSPDHLGLDGVDTIEDLAQVKAVVPLIGQPRRGAERRRPAVRGDGAPRPSPGGRSCTSRWRPTTRCCCAPGRGRARRLPAGQCDRRRRRQPAPGTAARGSDADRASAAARATTSPTAGGGGRR